MRSVFFAPALAAAATLVAGMALADTVRLATEGAYPPYNFINDAGEVDGFEKELGDRLCEIGGLTCEWVKNDWDSIIPNLQSGNYDAILAGMTITPERQAVIDFTQAYIPPTASAYAALAADTDLTGGIVSAQTGTIQANYVAETGATLLEFATADEALAAVRNGEADAVFADKDYLAPFVEESGGALVFVGDEIPIGEGIGSGVRKSDTELKAKLDDGIAQMKASGELNELIRKWFGDEVPTW